MVHILFAVRDDRAARTLMREMEDGQCLRMQIVHDGHAALDACARALPDLLVIDAALLGIDGPGVVDALHAAYGAKAPDVIGGASTALARSAFERRGACAVLSIPWNTGALRSAIQSRIQGLSGIADWEAAEAVHPLACALLDEMGMRSQLKGYGYLSWAVALAYASEESLFAVGRRLYAPIAQRFGTTQPSVERLIRHAVESTMDAQKARGVYNLLGNTVDPARGKPTNAQIVAALVQRLRVMPEGSEN